MGSWCPHLLILAFDSAWGSANPPFQRVCTQAIKTKYIRAVVSSPRTHGRELSDDYEKRPSVFLAAVPQSLTRWE